MKCILRAASLTTTPGIIERVSDLEAREETDGGRAVYKSKEAWKAQVRAIAKGKK